MAKSIISILMNMSGSLTKSIFRIIKNITRIIQGLLYVFGISIHNPYTNECVSDFSCCCKDIHNPFYKRVGKFYNDLKRMLR